MPKVEILQLRGDHFLYIDGELWMWTIATEQRAQKKICDQTYGKVLVAGYGLGILQRQLIENPKVTSLTTVEILPEVIQANRDTFGQIYGKVVIDDFFRMNGGEKYDCVIGDVWVDIEHEALELYQRFNSHAQSLIKPNGKILAWGQEFFEGLAIYYKSKTAG